MVKSPKKPGRIPAAEEIIAFIRENDGATKRDMARAFGLKGSDRVELKKLIRELQDSGRIARDFGKQYKAPDHLPKVTVVEVTGIDPLGDLTAVPTGWRGDSPPPRIFIMSRKRQRSRALSKGDRALVRLSAAEDDDGTYFAAEIIRVLPGLPQTVLGVVRRRDGAIWLIPTDRRARHEYRVSKGADMGAADRELVLAEPAGPSGGRGMSARNVRVIERLGDLSQPGSISLIALHHHGIPIDFPADALAEVARIKPADMAGREDLTAVPLITIDPDNARDHDDAVHAAADDDPKNKGGWKIIVAIADVSFYVRPGSALDSAARERGNSCYFPDRMVPMLPERLAADLCSLVEGKSRPVIAAHLTVDKSGKLLAAHFTRAVMRSHAFLSYTQVQRAMDGMPDKATSALMKDVIEPLYGAWEALERGRAARHPLNIEIPERRVQLDKEGKVSRIERRQRYTSHMIIEEMMILANVAAAKLLVSKNMPSLFRDHEAPGRDKLERLEEFLKSLDMRLAKGERLRPELFNRILAQVSGKPVETMVNEVILRSQMQAFYSPENLGHFGLNLGQYGHFTSPIRRYSDVIVHRGLVRALDLGEGGLEDSEIDELESLGEQISATERRAMAAERESTDRYLASYLEDQRGDVFDGRISGVGRFGLFVTIEPSGADGLIPISTLAGDYYIHDEARFELRGERSGRRYKLGDEVEVRLAEAEPMTGGIRFELIGDFGLLKNLPGRPKPKRKRKGRPKGGKGKRRHSRR